MMVWPSLRSGRSLQVFSQRLAGDGQAVAMQQTGIQQHPLHSRHAADVVEIFHHIAPAGLEVGQQRRTVGDSLEVVDGERHVRGLGHGNEVQHGVGGAAQGNRHGDRVLKALAGEDVAAV